MDQVVGTFNFTEDTIVAGGHPAVVMAGKLNAAQGALKAGLLLGKSATNYIPYESKDEVIGVGDAAAVNFTGSIAHAPIMPESVSITDTVETFTDDGHGRLTGDAGGTGTVNYTTGAYDITFNAAPGNAQDITASNHNVFAGVLEKAVDTANDEGCNYVRHGAVRADRLIKGAAAAALTSDDLMMLVEAQIYPV